MLCGKKTSSKFFVFIVTSYFQYIQFCCFSLNNSFFFVKSSPDVHFNFCLNILFHLSSYLFHKFSIFQMFFFFFIWILWLRFILNIFVVVCLGTIPFLALDPHLMPFYFILNIFIFPSCLFCHLYISGFFYTVTYGIIFICL